jgi:putative transposase
MIGTAYPSDLSEIEWLLIAPLIPPAKPGGRPRDTEMRAVLNGIFYVLRTGCGWEYLPHEYPCWQTVYGYFKEWSRRGVWAEINAALCEAVREQEEHEAEASAAIVDSQSVKTTASAGERGFDGAKLVTGRKRFILVDTLGLLLHVLVTKASLPERTGAKQLLTCAFTQTLHHLALLWADGGFSGDDFADWVRTHFGCEVEIVKRPGDAKGFVVLPRRWVVERTFAWLTRFRRLGKDFEVLVRNSEAFIYAAMSRLMLRRLANAETVFL